MNINEFNASIALLKDACLTQEEEAQLVLTIQRGEDRNDSARNSLIGANMYWSGVFVRKYQFSKIELEDLWQYANIGLTQSIDSFDPTLDVPFHKYAEFKMKSCVLEAISQYGSEFNLPKPTQIQLEKLRRETSALTQELGMEPTTEQIAEKMRLSADEVSFLLALKQRFSNVDDLYREAAITVNDDEVNENDGGIEFMVDEFTDIDNNKENQEEKLMNFSFQPPLDREIFVRSRGLLGYSAMTHAEILNHLNKIRRDNGLTPLTIEDIQIHYNRAVLIDRCMD